MAVKTYDLEERTTKFAQLLIEVCKKIPRNFINRPLLDQVIRSGTSIGANYREAIGSGSKLSFRHKIYICKQETNETEYWLTLLAGANPGVDLSSIQDEIHQLVLIFQKISTTLTSKLEASKSSVALKIEN